MDIRKIIPNALTAGNLFCGCVAVLAFISGQPMHGAILIGIAALLDFLDGFVARILKVSGDFGKQLDSLADMVSFGVAPGVILYVTLLDINSLKGYNEIIAQENYIPLLAFLVPVFSGIRLAIFNIDTKQSTGFIGLPTPANTLIVLCIPLLRFHPEASEVISALLMSNSFMIVFIVVSCILLVVPIPMIALKFKTFGIKENGFKYFLLAFALGALMIFGVLATPMILVMYIMLSVTEGILGKKKS